MGLQKIDGFLSKLSDLQQSQTDKKQGWISITIKRNKPKEMKKQLSKKKKQALIKSQEKESLMNPSLLYPLKYRARFQNEGYSTEILPGRAIKESSQLVNVFRLHFFADQINPKSKVIKKEATKPNLKSKNAKRRQERHKRNVERRKKLHEIKVQAKKKRQQALNIKHIAKQQQEQTEESNQPAQQ